MTSVKKGTEAKDCAFTSSYVAAVLSASPLYLARPDAHLLNHRKSITLITNNQLKQASSVYDHHNDIEEDERRKLTLCEFAFEKGLLLPVSLLNRLKIFLGKFPSFLPKLTHLTGPVLRLCKLCEYIRFPGQLDQFQTTIQ